jgi:kumamolisin
MAAILPGYRQIDNSLRPPRRGARATGPTDPNEKVVLSLVVRRRPGAPALPDQRYWMAVPPGRRKFPSRSEFAAKYGASPEDLQAVAQFCRSNGLTVVDTSAARRCVVASGAAQVVARAFHIELMRYQTANETYRGHDGYIQLPNEIAAVVDGVLGFDNRRLGTHASNGGVPGATPLTPIQVAQYYNFPSFTGSGQWKNAAGQTIGILEFGGVNTGSRNDSIIPDFQNYFGNTLQIPNSDQAQVITVPPNQAHYGSAQSPDPRDVEVALDVEVAGAVAQGAKIVVYFGSGFGTGSLSETIPDEMGWYSLVSAAAMDDTNKPTVLSISWGAAESEWPPGTIAMMQTLFAEVAAAGITVFASSGDYGSSDYNPQDPNWQSGAHVNYPASDPSITGCGGTTIVSNGSTMQQMWSQQTWNDSGGATMGGATGGGFSSSQVPPWQSGLKYNNTPFPGRGVPDVAGNASPYSGYSLILYGETTVELNNAELNTLPTPIVPAYVGGTSAVAPLYAGLIALLNANLFPSSATSQMSIGPLNPTLYGVPSDVTNVLFQDIHDNGTNFYNGQLPAYQTEPGWDPCTGWGSINGVALLETLLIGYVASNPGCLASIQSLAKALLPSFR